MNIVFDKSLGRKLLVTIFKRQSSRCQYCDNKVTEKNLGMVVQTEDGMRARCNSVLCLIQYVNEKDSK